MREHSPEAGFWDRAAEKYATRPVADQEAYEHTLARTRVHLKPQDRVLEIGCGTGTTALKLADAVHTTLATDVSSAMIGIAKKKRVEAGVENVAFKVCTVFDDALETGGFDVVTAFNLFHLLDDPEAAARRVRTLLKEDGLFISKTPCLGARAWLYGPMIWLLRLFGRAPKVRLFRIAEYDALIESAGFEVIETGVFPATFGSRFVVARRAGGRG